MNFIPSAPRSLFPDLDRKTGMEPSLFNVSDFGTQFGLLSRQKIELMVRRRMIAAPRSSRIDSSSRPALTFA